jgi:hypothetical protein
MDSKFEKQRFHSRRDSRVGDSAFRSCCFHILLSDLQRGSTASAHRRQTGVRAADEEAVGDAETQEIERKGFRDTSPATASDSYS